MTDTTRVRLRTSGGILIESVDVTPMGEGRYRLEEPLAMSSDIAMHDVIETREDTSGCLKVTRVVESAGFRRLEYDLPRESLRSEPVQKKLSEVEQLGGNWVVLMGGILVVNVPPSASWELWEDG
jgi:hypothetical protein